MNKFAVFVSGALLLINTAQAGGILTNTNQSAQFVRMLSRNASIDLDAVYFNPAGLTQLKNGFYFGLHNQTIFQTKTISSEFGQNSSPKLSLLYDKYEGDVKAPVFPSAFAVYKTDNWAFSAGFGPNAGGGSAKYDHGLPSFEKQIARLVPALSGLSSLGYPVTNYDVDISFEGTSVFWGIQGGATYKVNKAVSVYLGARYVPAVNTYKGSISNIQVGTAGALKDAKTYLAGAAAVATAKSQATSTAAASLKPLVDGGAGNYTLAQVQAAGYITATKKAQIEAGLQQLGLTSAQISAMSVSTAQTTYSTSSAYLGGVASSLNSKIPALGDKREDTKQTGTGITPIIGVDIHLNKLNVGLKYEHKTYITLTNSTTVDDINMFPDGQKSSSDIPAIIAGGADYQFTHKLKLSGSFNVYLDKNVDWGNNIYGVHRTIDKNYVELAFGAEYKLTDKFLVSAGYLNSNTGVSETYQSDFGFSNDSYTVGTGLQWNLNERLVLDAGLMLTTYKDDSKTFTEAAPIGTYKETYKKNTFTVAFGIAYKIF
jgi:long-subunit fatty acid transport protein